MNVTDSANELSRLFSELYFHCHPNLEVELSHQAVRGMQFIAMTGPATIHELSSHLNVKHNTTSEIVRRLQSKNLVIKQRRHDDERVVEVQLTQAGISTVLQHTGLDITRLAEALGKMPEKERKAIQDSFGKLLYAIRRNEE